jgi:hypothetical protein
LSNSSREGALAVRASTFLLAVSLGSCVTINIYFPAAAAEKAADKIIDEVWQLEQQKGREPGDRTPAEQPK